MMEEMDHKREMIKQLLDMLKSSAADEVGHGLPGHTKGVEIEKISVLPHEKMAEGGMPSDSDEPGALHEIPSEEMDGSADAEALKNLPAAVEDEEAEKDALQSDHNANIMDEDEDNNSSAFQAFLPRRKKK